MMNMGMRMPATLDFGTTTSSSGTGTLIMVYMVNMVYMVKMVYIGYYTSMATASEGGLE